MRRSFANRRAVGSAVTRGLLTGSRGVGKGDPNSLDWEEMKTRWRPRRWQVALGVLGILVLAVVGAAHPVARWQTRRVLQQLDGLEGDFLDARLSFFPLVYRISHLKLTEPTRQTKEPLVYIDEASLQLLWTRLLTGHLAVRIQSRGVKVVLEQPVPGRAGRLPGLTQFIPWPVVFERVQVKSGEVLYVWVHEKYRPTLWFHDIEATLENLGSRPDLTPGPLTLAGAGNIQRRGTMSVLVQADPFAIPLNFLGKARLEDFDVSQMNTLIDSKNDVKLKPGQFSMRMTFESKQGRLTGRVEPHLESTEIVGHDDALGALLKAWLARISMAVSSPTDGTLPSGTILVQDDLTQPDRQLLLAMENVVENGFLLGIQESLKRVYGQEPPKHPDPTRKPATELKTTR
jgi:hypothetical protein